MSANSDDPFDILSQELTALRRSIEHLARTSLNKDEAEALNQMVAQALKDMRKATRDAPKALQDELHIDRDQMARMASQAATEAAERVLGNIHDQLKQDRIKLSQASGEARREAWRWFGGFWVWLASVGTAGALLGALAMAWIGGTISARDFGDYPGVFCSSTGGQVVEQSDGSTFCAVWIERAPEAQN